MSVSQTVALRAYHKDQKELEWREWLHTLVYIDFRDEKSIVKRFQSFQYFVNAGLVPFVKAHGYVFRVGIHLANELANYLYSQEKYDFRLQPFEREVHGKIEINIDLDYYQLRGIPIEDWDAFWTEWQWMTDFNEENYRNKYRIPGFVYNRLNLDLSEVTEKLTKELDDADGYEEYHFMTDQASDAIGQGKDRNSLY